MPRLILVHEANRSPVDRSREGDESVPASAPHPVLTRLAPEDSGLQLFSDDCVWLRRAAPALRRLPVTYRVRLGRSPDAALVSRLKRGVTDYGEFLAATDARLVESGPTRDWLEVTLNRGRSTTVRRLFSAFGVAVKEVKRTVVGPLRLGTLASNERRSLTDHERAELLALRTG